MTANVGKNICVFRIISWMEFCVIYVININQNDILHDFKYLFNQTGDDSMMKATASPVFSCRVSGPKIFHSLSSSDEFISVNKPCVVWLTADGTLCHHHHHHRHVLLLSLSLSPQIVCTVC